MLVIHPSRDLPINKLDIAGADSTHAILVHVKVDDIFCGWQGVANNCSAGEENIGPTIIRNDEAVFLFS